MKADVITLKEAARTFEGSMIVLSRTIDRQPCGEPTEGQIAALIRKEAALEIVWKTPERLKLKPGQAWCAECGPLNKSNFAANKHNANGLDHFCKECRKLMNEGNYLKHRDIINTARRDAYAAKIAREQGRAVRAYTRHEHRQVEVAEAA